MPLLLLIAAFTILPLTELWLLLEVKDRIGVGSTLALVLVTGVVGASLARRQGIATLRAIQTDMAEGRLPTQALLDGVLILFAAAVLVTPGIVTDVLGFTLLIPPARRGVGRLVARWAKARVSVHTTLNGAPVAPAEDGVVDAEVLRSGPAEPEEPKPISLIGTGEPVDAEFEVRP